MSSSTKNQASSPNLKSNEPCQNLSAGKRPIKAPIKANVRSLTYQICSRERNKIYQTAQVTFLFLHTSILQFKYCTSKGNNDPCLFAYAINYTKNNLKKSIQVPQTVTTTVADASNLLLQLVVKESKKDI